MLIHQGRPKLVVASHRKYKFMYPRYDLLFLPNYYVGEVYKFTGMPFILIFRSDDIDDDQKSSIDSTSTFSGREEQDNVRAHSKESLKNTSSQK